MGIKFRDKSLKGKKSGVRDREFRVQSLLSSLSRRCVSGNTGESHKCFGIRSSRYELLAIRPQ